MIESTTIEAREALGGECSSLEGSAESMFAVRQASPAVKCRWRYVVGDAGQSSIALTRLLCHLDVVEVGRHFEALLAQLGRQGLPFGGR